MAYGLEEYARQICAAQAAYKYPTVTYDFTAHRESRHTTMADVEKRIQEQLRSRNQEEVKDGLSNVLYWGYASQRGRQRNRVSKFREKITTEQLNEFINLLSGEHCFSFDYVINLRLPEFSGMSFVSKLLMFLCPDTHPVLDLKIARFAQLLGFPPLQDLKIYPTRIPLTKQNVQGYEQWAVWCTGVADQVNAEPSSPYHGLRAVDVERAIFWQVNSGYEKEASLLLQAPQSVSKEIGPMAIKPGTVTPAALLNAMWVDGDPEPAPLVLDFRPVLDLLAQLGYTERDVDRWLIEFNHANHELVGKLELDADGVLLATPMPGVKGSRDETQVFADLNIWCREYGGNAHGSRLGMRLPNGQRYAPDAAWISPEQQANRPPPYPAPDDWLLPFCPAFVVEVRSRSDRLAPIRRKMAEYVANGALLAWLIDPFLRQVHVYRPGVAPEALDDPETVSGEPELPGFVFEVRRRIFDLRQPAE